MLAGALALAGLFVVRASAPRYLWDGLTSGLGLALVCVCALAGVVTMVLVWVGRFALARASAALAVAAVIAGWAAAQEPRLLPGADRSAAAAPRATLIATIVGVAVGALVLVLSLLLLYTLVLRGRLDTQSVQSDRQETRYAPRRCSSSAAFQGAGGRGGRGSCVGRWGRAARVRRPGLGARTGRRCWRSAAR